MRKIIHHLRRQPEEVRRHILHIFILVAGIILVSFWIYSLGANLDEAEVEIDKTAESPNPFSVIKDNLALPEW